MDYIDLYSFQVIDELKKGSDIRALDKNTNTVYEMNNFMIPDFVKFINEAETNVNRFYFYKVERDDEID